MRYPTELKFRKYVKGCDVLSFARKFGDKYGETSIDAATKERNRCCKNCF